MGTESEERAVVSAGDAQGQGSVYNSEGRLIALNGEGVLRSGEGWDVNVLSPWRKLLPHILFEGFNGRATSVLYITTHRVVLIREIDVWRELKGEFTALGTPNAAAKQWLLSELKSRGVRQYCIIDCSKLRVVAWRKYVRPKSLIYLRAFGEDGRRYGISIWKTDGTDQEMLTMLASRFGK